AETLVGLASGLAICIVVGFNQTAYEKTADFVAPPARPTAKCVPLIRGVAKPPMFRDLGRDPALFQIFPRRRADFSLDQIFMKPFCGFSMQFQQCPARFILSIFV